MATECLMEEVPLVQLGKAFHLETKEGFPLLFSSSFVAEESRDCSAIKAKTLKINVGHSS